MARPIINITRVNGLLHASLGGDSRRSLQETLRLLQDLDQSCGEDWMLGASARRAAEAVREVLRAGATPAPAPKKSGGSRGPSAPAGKELGLPVGDR